MCVGRVALTLALLAPELNTPELKLGPTDAAAQVPVFRGGIDLVQMGVTVADRKSALITGLTPDDFEIYEDGRKQTIQFFAAGQDADAPSALHLGLLLDVSQSMAGTVGFTRTAAIKFLNTLTDAVDVTVVDFDTQVRVARYGQSDFARLVERIREQEVRGSTALYDAIGVYLDGAADQDGRKIMLLYTDGGDTRSALRFGELLDLLKAADVTVYAIGAPEPMSSSVRAEPRMILRQITEATGGAAFFPSDVKGLDQVYGQVLAEIRAQYTLGYVSTNPRADGKWRKVEIKLRDARAAGAAEAGKAAKDRRVRSRSGYFAPLRPSP